MKTVFRWLHLTDLHVGGIEYDSFWPTIRENFKKDLASLLESGGDLDFIVISGDFVDRGSWNQSQEKLDGFLADVRSLTQRRGIASPIFFVPGNHDPQHSTLDALLKHGLKSWHTLKGKELRDEFWTNPRCPLREAVKRAFAAYESWGDKNQSGNLTTSRKGLLPGDFSATVSKGGINLGIVGLNTAFVQIARGVTTVDVDVRQLHAATNGRDGPEWCGQHDACLLITHHPPDFRALGRRRHFEQEIASPGRFLVHLCGDLHEISQRNESNGGATPRRVWRGASLFGVTDINDPKTEHRIHGYSIGEVAFLDGQTSVRQFPRRALSKPQWRFITDPEILTDPTGATNWDPQIVINERLVAGEATAPFDLPPSNTISQNSEIHQPLIVHRYSLLDSSKGLIGRQSMLRLLDTWAKPTEKKSVMTIHAIGGTGKSALAWTWFNSQFPTDKQGHFVGGLWYCFYTPGATFSDFLKTLYSYVMGKSSGTGIPVTLGESEFRGLFDVLAAQPFLLALDGFERALKAYRRSTDLHRNEDAAKRRNLERDRELRTGIDQNVDDFLLALDRRMRSRLLITSRLAPAALTNNANEDRQYTQAISLNDLDDAEVLELFAVYGVTRTTRAILRISNSFGNHALLCKLLATLVSRSPAAGKSLSKWLKQRNDFNPCSLDVTENQAHVLEYALSQLTIAERTVLQQICAFSGAVRHSDLEDILVGHDVALPTSMVLEEALLSLEAHELIGIERDTARYDAHPLVRGTIWGQSSETEKEKADQLIIQQFSAYPPLPETATFADLNPLKERFLALVRRRRYDEAWEHYTARLEDLLFSANGGGRLLHAPTVVDLLSSLLAPDEMPMPQLRHRVQRSHHLLVLGRAHEFVGEYERGLACLQRHRVICPDLICPAHQAGIAETCGHLIEAEAIQRNVLAILRKHKSGSSSELKVISHLWGSLERRGIDLGKDAVSRTAWIIRQESDRKERRKMLSFLFGLRASRLWKNIRADDTAALDRLERLTRRELKIAIESLDHYREVQLLCTSGAILMARNDVQACIKISNQAVDHARQHGLVELVPSLLLNLARANLATKNFAAVEQYLTEARGITESSGARLIQAEIRLEEGRLARDRQDADTAIDLGNEAYRLAWCDGPPFADIRNLQKAEELLKQLGAEAPKNLRQGPLPADWIEIELNPAEVRNVAQYASASTPTPTDDDPLSRLFVWDKIPQTLVDRLIEDSQEALEEGRFVDAERLSAEAIDKDPYGHDCWAARGRARWWAGRLGEAVTDYSRAIEIAPDGELAEYYGERGQIQALHGMAEEALKDLGIALDEIGISPRLVCAKALALTLLARTNESSAAFDEATISERDKPWIFFYRAKALELRRLFTKARASYQKCLKRSETSLPRWMRDVAKHKSEE